MVVGTSHNANRLLPPVPKSRRYLYPTKILSAIMEVTAKSLVDLSYIIKPSIED
jgi:hypothetical protein